MRSNWKVLISIILVIFLRILFQFYFFQNLEHKAQDSFFRIRGPIQVSNDIVIVAIDDNTLQALDQQWPFPRDLHAKLIDNLYKAGARQIIFDIQFTEYTEPYSDGSLAASAYRAQNVIFAGKYIVSSDNPDHQQMQSPIQPLIARGMNWGLVNMSTDWDGYVREYTLFETMSDNHWYSLGIAAIANSKDLVSEWYDEINVFDNKLAVASYQIPIIKRNKTLINYFGPAETFPHVSYVSILDDGSIELPGQFGVQTLDYFELLKSNLFYNKIVLIGATLDELHDKFPTPFSSSLTSGVEIHANFIEMVKQNNFLKVINPMVFFFLELILAIALFYLFTWFKPQLSIFLAIILSLLFFVTLLYLFIRIQLLIPLVEVILLVVCIYITSLIMHYIRSQKEKLFIKNAFQQYMAPELVEKLLATPGNLKYGGSLQDITVLFSDIRGFTPYSEKHQPEETVQILKDYLTGMVETIKNNKGIVDKFVGDEIMALYGTPIPYSDHPLQACKTALQMREVYKQMQDKLISEGKEGFEIGIGVNTGIAVVGNLGSEQIFDYTAIGDTINLGARIQDLNKEYNATNKIIISEFTYDRVKENVIANYLDEVKVKGKEKTVKIYELLELAIKE